MLNDEINSAREVTKTDALRLHTFQSRAAGVLGVVDADDVVYYRKPVRRSGARSEFDVTGLDHLPRVDVFLVYQDAPGDLIEAAVDAGAKGLVMATAGAGAISGTQGDGLAYAADRGVFVVRSTRTGSGRVASDPPGGARRSEDASPEMHRRQAFTVAADDLTPVKARLLLMLGLTRTSNRDELQRMFLEILRARRLARLAARLKPSRSARGRRSVGAHLGRHPVPPAGPPNPRRGSIIPPCRRPPISARGVR